MSKIIKVYVNRMREDGTNVILVGDSSTCSCTKYEIAKETSTRDYIIYLLAKEMKSIYDAMKDDSLDRNNSYTFILESMGKEITYKKTRNSYITTGKNSKGDKLPDGFLNNVKMIQSMLNEFYQNGVKVRLCNDYTAKPHEYNGRTYGSEINVKMIAKTWDALETIVPRKDVVIDDDIEFEIRDAN